MKQNVIYALLLTGVFCTLNACSNDLNGLVAPDSANETVTYACPDTEWEEYFMALDSLNQIFFPVSETDIMLADNDTTKDDNTKLHKVVVADAAGAIEGYKKTKSWKGAVVDGTLASLLEFASQYVELHNSVNMQGSSLLKLTNDTIENIGKIHNSIIYTLAQQDAKSSINLQTIGRKKLSLIVLQLYTQITHEPITSELTDLAINYTNNYYNTIPKKVQMANSNYFEHMKELEGEELTNYTYSYKKVTQQKLTNQVEDANLINVFTTVAYYSKLLWSAPEFQIGRRH